MADTKDERVLAFRAAWWDADYSWAGLAGKQISGKGLHGEKTLQDYWRRDPQTGAVRDDAAMQAAGELAYCDGVLFHIVHLPPATKAGESTWKADLREPGWDRLEALIRARVAAGVETSVSVSGNADGPDGRAQLAGAVVRHAITHPLGKKSALHLDAWGLATLGEADYRGQAFGPGVRFGVATFSGPAAFAEATFSGDARFAGALFLSRTLFDTAGFVGGCDFQSAMFAREAGFFNATFSGDIRFDSATFLGDARFEGATFSGNAGFGNATFKGYAGFGGVTFPRDAMFAGAIFLGSAGFDRATFSRNAWFNSATFSGSAGFERATFSGNADFDNAKFSGTARFELAQFSGTVGFRSVAFAGAAGFHGAGFRRYTIFDSAIFSADAVFERAVFSEGAGFERAKFLGNAGFERTNFFGDAGFERATFLGTAGFRGAAFSGNTLFDSATFSGNARFVGANFSGDVRFDGATFSGDVGLESATISGDAGFRLAAFAGSLNCRATRFQRLADFLGQGAALVDLDRRATLTLPEDGKTVGEIAQAGAVTPRARRAFVMADFEDAIFEGDADFSNRDFLEPSSFRSAIFHGLVEFHGSALHQGQTFHGARETDVVSQPWPTERVARRVHGVATALAELSRLEKRRPSRPPAFDTWRAKAKADWLAREGKSSWEEGVDHWLFARPMSDNARYERIEAAFRSLKLAMEGVRNRVEEQRYYRLELLARRRRRDIPVWERWVSHGYEQVSDFGNALGRPFWALLWTALLFAALYAGWGAVLGLSSNAWDALSFSAGRVAPFGPWADDPAWLTALDTKGSAWGFAGRLVATVQSLFAIVLAFLFALAVRRRFQIS